MLIKILIIIVVQWVIMNYRNLSDLNKNGQTWNIKVKIMRFWEYVNNKTDQLVSFDMILMDVMSRVSFFYIMRNKSRPSIRPTFHGVAQRDGVKWS
jgi:hypothetical protein